VLVKSYDKQLKFLPDIKYKEIIIINARCLNIKFKICSCQRSNEIVFQKFDYRVINKILFTNILFLKKKM
jgi:hypothetical protein